VAGGGPSVIGGILYAISFITRSEGSSGGVCFAILIAVIASATKQTA